MSSQTRARIVKQRLRSKCIERTEMKLERITHQYHQTLTRIAIMETMKADLERELAHLS